MRRSGTVALLGACLLLAAWPGSSAAEARRAIHFGGRVVRAPASWPVVRLARHPHACVRLDRRVVYLGEPGAAESCPAAAIGRRRAILVHPRGSAAAARASRAPPVRVRAASEFTGLGFDACTAPSRRSMSAWGASPYRAIGVYIGGLNRACAQPNLTPSWVSEQVRAGWHLIPTYVGLQAPTSSCGSCAKLSAAAAAAQGTAAAEDAVDQARLVGIGPGSPIYFDMESYTRTSSASTATLQFLGAWTTRLHALGYVSGVYSSSSSGIADLAARYGSGYPSPDDIWTANWNGRRNGADPYLPAGAWSDHQRIHQYSGGHDESYGGVTINIDSDYVEGATAGAVAASGQDPRGRFELARSPLPGNVQISGWAFDPSAPTSPVAIRAYVGGRRGAERRDLGPIAALPRPDVAAGHTVAGEDHGFEVSFPTLKTGRQRVCVYAVDIGPGSDRLLGCRGIAIGVAVTLGPAQRVGGALSVPLQCNWPAGSECPGQVMLRARVRMGGRGHTHLVRVSLGRRAFRLSGGESRVIRVQLSRRGRQLSAAPGALRAQLLVAIPGGRRGQPLLLR